MEKKTILLVIVSFIVSVAVNAQGKPGRMSQKQHTYVPFVRNETNKDSLLWRNEQLKNRGVKTRGFWGDLAKTMETSYKTTVVQKTVNATSNLISLGVNMFTTWMNRNKTNREAWLKTAKAQCHFEQNLGTQTYIDDFYFDSSKNGALDPLYMKFNGFGCKGYLKAIKETSNTQNPNKTNEPDNISVNTSKGDKGFNEGVQPKAKNEKNIQTAEVLKIPSSNDKEDWEFYVTCKLRTDSVGLNHIANHSKFYVDLDTLVVDTRHLSLPCDSTSGQIQKAYDYRGRKDLTFRINVKVYSSWVNEAIMLTENQKIGEFNITAKIDSTMIQERGDSIFVFDKNNVHHRESVSVDGDCFLVPRSYTGTADNPSWGTGQYRIDMTIYETCAVNEEYYQIPSVGNGKEIAKNNTPGKTKWDKRKWQTEWNEMQQRQKGASVWKNMWSSIKKAYIGSDWVTELVSPAANAVYEQEAVSLNDLFKLDSTNTNGGGAQGQTSNGAMGNTQDQSTEGAQPAAGKGMPEGATAGQGMPQK